jgi:hypothetical protein
MNRTQPTLSGLLRGLRRDGAITIEMEGGAPILRASRAAQDSVEGLLVKQRSVELTPDEEMELRQYEELDDYLSYLNRLTRNLAASPPDTEEGRAA